MKKSATNQHLTAWEADIRRDAQNRALARVLTISKRLEKQAKVLLLDILKLTAEADGPPGLLPEASALTRRLDPISNGHLVAAQAVLEGIQPAGTPLTPTQIAEAWGKEYGGQRMASLACARLVAKGQAEWLGRKGYRAVQRAETRETSADLATSESRPRQP